MIDGNATEILIIQHLCTY